jgi:predicted RNase H-like HicB family nuclease
MSEIVFQVEEDPLDGGYVAHALGHGITTQAESVVELRRMIRDAVRCHFDKPKDRRRVIRLIRGSVDSLRSSGSAPRRG